MSERETIRVPPDLKKQVAPEMKRRGIATKQDFYVEAIKHFLQCKTFDTTGAMRLIVLKYPANCLYHKDERIEAGQWAYYGSGVGAICLDAFIERLGDKAIVRKYLKNRELERTHKFLKAECNRLADRLETFEIGDKALVALRQVELEHDLAMRYFKEGLGTPEEKEFLEDLMRSNKKTKEIIRDVEDYLQKMLRLKKWKRKRKDQQTTEAYQ